MTDGFLEIAATPSVITAQIVNGSRTILERRNPARPTDRLSQAEIDFIIARDSFYMATVSETGWPYVQHRGGPAGFLKVLDDRTLAFADFRGNRQYISVGNIAANGRAALILMDYANRRRLKMYVRVEARDLAADPDLADRLALPGYPGRPERAFVLHLLGFNWNCPQHITPRYTEAEMASALTPIRARMAELEAENERLRQQLRALGERTTAQDAVA